MFDVGKEILYLENKVNKAQKYIKKLNGINYLKSEYNPDCFLYYDCIIAKDYLKNCNKISILGSSIAILSCDLYFKDGDYKIIGKKFQISYYNHLKKEYFIYDYESEIPSNYKNRKQVIKKIEKEIFNHFKKWSVYGNSINKNSFNYDKFQTYLIFS